MSAGWMLVTVVLGLVLTGGEGVLLIRGRGPDPACAGAFRPLLPADVTEKCTPPPSGGTLHFGPGSAWRRSWMGPRPLHPQVDLPLSRHLPGDDQVVDTGYLGLPPETHPRLVGHTIPLALVAPAAGAGRVAPGVAPAPAAGDQVIHGEVGAGENPPAPPLPDTSAAVHAGVAVAGHDAAPAPHGPAPGDVDVVAQPQHGGHLENRAGRAQPCRDALDTLGNTPHQQADRPADGDDPQGLVCSVEQ